MRRWNGWGDESNMMELPSTAYDMLGRFVGQASPLKDAGYDDVLSAVPASRLSEHPLLDLSPDARLRHARGQSLPDWLAMRSGEFTVFPDAVAFPETSEQVREILDLAQSVDALVIPYGGGTSVAGHITPPASDKPIITVALTRMNKLLNLDTDSQIATFGAGTAGPELEAQLAAKGYVLGHFPQSWELSTVGGWVVTRSSGQQSLRYGRIEQMFAGGRVETPIGQWDIPTIPATSAGLDLREMLMGSEGRMGILTEVKVRVTPLPETQIFQVAFAPNWEQARNAVQAIVQTKIPLSMLRVSNATETFTGMRLSVSEKQVGLLDKLLKLRGVGEEKCMITFGLTGTKQQVRAYRKQAKTVFKQYKVVSVLGNMLGEKWEHGRFRFPYLRHPLWEMGYAVDTFETAVDWNNLDGYIQDAEDSIRNGLADEGEKIHVFTHLSHLYPQGSSAYTTYIFRCADTYEETLARWKKLKRLASEAIVRNGGTISHQHGVGRDHAPYMPAEKGALGMSAIQSAVKHFDPDARMNPGTLLED